MLVTKALSPDVTILAFAPYSLFLLEALLCIESTAADVLATLRFMCFFLWQEQFSVLSLIFKIETIKGF